MPSPPHRPDGRHINFDPLPPAHKSSRVKYWNEYDNGSDAGNPEDDYAIYINPDEGIGFPGLGYIQHILKLPIEKARSWFNSRQTAERQPLLPELPSPEIYYSSTVINTDSEDGYTSSVEFPYQGYAAHYALPSISQQKVIRYREKVYFWGTIGCFVGSFLLLAIAGLLILTGRHRLRAEVDAGVTIGVVASLFSACSALGMTMYRRDPLTLPHRLMVWSTFIALCFLNGILLVLVVGNAP